MARTVDLRQKPYNLNEEQIAWVENTILSMSDEQKIGQLFFHLFMLDTSDDFHKTALKNKEIIEKYHIGGVRYHNGNKHQVQELLNSLQSVTKTPLFVAANCDSGGNGACSDGTYIASAAQVEASASEEVAFHAGLVSAREADALGVHINFDPCVDILFNWRNTIVNTRSYGNNAEDVIKYSDAFIDGYRSEKQMITCIKHWPGDGVEERDQHLVLGVNDLSVEEWEASFGKVYRHHIEKGVEMIMSAHFVLPNYQKLLNPTIKEEEMLPATLSHDLTQVLLKEKLGFNGMVVTDASHMIGMACMMKRCDYVPAAIAAGCDMFLFFNDVEEDFNYMLQGYRNNVITTERLHDALRRILGLKAKLNLHIKHQENALQKSECALDVIGCEEHLNWRSEAADKGITLVKDTQKLLPISPEKHKRICLFYLTSANSGLFKNDSKTCDLLKAELEKRGYEVEIKQADTRIKGSIEAFKSQYDLVLTVLDIVGYAAENNYRVSYPAPMSIASPWYIREVPTIVISLNYTTHLHDYSAAKTYINAYHGNESVLRALCDKLEGLSAFKGSYNENVWTDKWEAKL